MMGQALRRSLEPLHAFFLFGLHVCWRLFTFALSFYFSGKLIGLTSPWRHCPQILKIFAPSAVRQDYASRRQSAEMERELPILPYSIYCSDTQDEYHILLLRTTITIIVPAARPSLSISLPTICVSPISHSGLR